MKIRSANSFRMYLSKLSSKQNAKLNSEDGSAMVIALLVMMLLMGFVALAITRTNSETVASSNDEAESRTFDAAHASLEIMTRNFDKIFDNKLNPDSTDFTRIEGQAPPGFANYNYVQRVLQTGPSKNVVMTGEMFQGLNAVRDEWQLDTTATDAASGVQVALRRRFLNNRIPIFQFGIFYDDDMEFHPGPRFDFGGRVHSNGNIFMQASTGLYFSSKVSAHAHVFTDVSKSGRPYTDWDDNVFIRNASGVYVQLQFNMGSVLASPVNGVAATTSPEPTAYNSANWTTNRGQFQGNLLADVPQLSLPIKLNATINNTTVDLVQLVKRGKSVGDVWNDGSGGANPAIVAVTAATKDDGITASERYYNKPGIRVALADSKVKLPGCSDAAGAPVAGACGVRLEGDAVGQTAGAIAGVRGYRPRAMAGLPAYQATELNGERFVSTGKETWIKVETVQFNSTTQAYDINDITQDILSLGVTEPAPAGIITDPAYGISDSRSILKLQRFVIPGGAIPRETTAPVGATFMTPVGANNYVVAATVSARPATNLCNIAFVRKDGGASVPNAFVGDNQGHFKRAVSAVGGSGTPGNVGSTYGCIVPFPINMFDTREGLYNETVAVFNPTSTVAPGYGAAWGTKVPWAGVMSMIDIDVANLRSFLSGAFDANMPGGTPYAIANLHVLRSTDIPTSNGWVFYVSDRRGDYDFDGEYDMEDVFGNNDGNLQNGEDVNGNGTLQADYANHAGASEAVLYTGATAAVSPDIAAVFEHKYYRRGVRLINGTRLPGNYDSVTPSSTRGFTVASENGVYVLGNYNATGVASVGSPTPPADYLPQNTVDHIPASIAADAVTVLSNGWTDANSFRFPFTVGSRNATETTARFAMLAGDAITTLGATPNQGGGDPRMNGGVHNFIRFLETWPVRLNYCGSLINLFYAHNNNGTYKNGGGSVYSPPTRNWVFDTSFLDINRIPPGTPFFQSIQITGFQRVN